MNIAISAVRPFCFYFSFLFFLYVWGWALNFEEVTKKLHNFYVRPFLRGN
jgi:hypothetical protein